MNVEFALNITIAGLLLTVICFGFVLNRRLRQVRDGRQEMEVMLAEFVEATTRAQAGIAALKQLTGGDAESLTGQYEKIARLREELEFLVGRADEQSVKLEHLIREGRGMENQGAVVRPEFGGGEARSNPPVHPRARENELDDALFTKGAGFGKNESRPHIPEMSNAATGSGGAQSAGRRSLGKEALR